MTLTTAKWSIADYHQMIAAGILDDRPVELLNGEIVDMPSEGAPHAGLSTKAAEYLRDLLGRQVQIREGHPITIPSSNSEPEPDIAIVKRSPDSYTQHHPYPEDVFWLIEYANSSLKKDLDPKAKIYAAAGITEYWVVNLQTIELVVMRDPVDGEYRSQMTLKAGAIDLLGFAGVVVEVGKLLG
jgi:Uma2 family endonuclease